MSRQVIKSATKKRLLDLGFPATVAHDLARGVKFTELLKLSYDEPLHEETTMTPKSIIENSAHVNLLDLAPYYARSNTGEWEVENAYSFEKRLSKAIEKLNSWKMAKLSEWFIARKIEESGYFEYYGINYENSRYWSVPTGSVGSGYASHPSRPDAYYLLQLPRITDFEDDALQIWSQAPRKLKDFIRRFPNWEAQLRARERSLTSNVESFLQDEIRIKEKDFLESYGEEWSAYIEGKLWKLSPRQKSLNFPKGI